MSPITVSELDAERTVIIALLRWQRRQQARLQRNPDCRDPDHPGCAACEDEKCDDD